MGGCINAWRDGHRGEVVPVNRPDMLVVDLRFDYTVFFVLVTPVMGRDSKPGRTISADTARTLKCKTAPDTVDGEPSWREQRKRVCHLQRAGENLWPEPLGAFADRHAAEDAGPVMLVGRAPLDAGADGE